MLVSTMCQSIDRRNHVTTEIDLSVIDDRRDLWPPTRFMYMSLVNEDELECLTFPLRLVCFFAQEIQY